MERSCEFFTSIYNTWRQRLIPIVHVRKLIFRMMWIKEHECILLSPFHLHYNSHSRRLHKLHRVVAHLRYLAKQIRIIPTLSRPIEWNMPRNTNFIWKSLKIKHEMAGQEITYSKSSPYGISNNSSLNYTSRIWH